MDEEIEPTDDELFEVNGRMLLMSADRLLNLVRANAPAQIVHNEIGLLIRRAHKAASFNLKETVPQ